MLSKDEMDSSHPDLNALAAVVDGRVTEEERSAVLEHLGRCVECRSVLAVVVQGQSAASHRSTGANALENGGGAAPAGRVARRRFPGAAVWLPIAATLTLATTVGIFVRRADRGAVVPPLSAPVAPGITAPPSTAPAAGTTAPEPAPASPVTGSGAEPLAARRGAVRQIDGKTFRFVAGEWVDSAYDPVGLLPVENVDDADARAAVLGRTPALKPFAALGSRVLVVHEGVVYRFRLP